MGSYGEGRFDPCARVAMFELKTVTVDSDQRASLADPTRIFTDDHDRMAQMGLLPLHRTAQAARLAGILDCGAHEAVRRREGKQLPARATKRWRGEQLGVCAMIDSTVTSTTAAVATAAAIASLDRNGLHGNSSSALPPPPAPQSQRRTRLPLCTHSAQTPEQRPELD